MEIAWVKIYDLTWGRYCEGSMLELVPEYEELLIDVVIFLQKIHVVLRTRPSSPELTAAHSTSCQNVKTVVLLLVSFESNMTSCSLTDVYIHKRILRRDIYCQFTAFQIGVLVLEAVWYRKFGNV